MESRGTLFLALAIVSAFLLIPSTRGATIAGTDADDSWGEQLTCILTFLPLISVRYDD